MRKSLQAYFPTAFTTLPPNSKRPCSHLYVDVNPFLYAVSRSASIYTPPSSILRSAIGRLTGMFSTYPSTECTVLAVDGPATLAKFNVQRERRHDNARISQLKEVFDTQQFTPGTIFMASANNTFTDYLINRSTRKWGKLRNNVSYIYDGANTSGEAETKLMKYISLFHSSTSWNCKENFSNGNSSNHEDKNGILLTSDSDALLSLMLASDLIQQSTVCIDPFRIESSMFSPIAFTKSLANSCSTLINAMEKSMNLDQIKTDLAVLFLFSGNDYHPQLKYSSFPALWDFYSKTFKLPLFNTSLCQFNFSNLYSFCEEFVNSRPREMLALMQDDYEADVKLNHQLSHIESQDYLRSIQIQMWQLLNTGCETSASFRYRHTAAPSIFQLARTLKEMPKLFEEQPRIVQLKETADSNDYIKNTENINIPGAAAILLLDHSVTTSTQSASYIVPSLQPLFHSIHSTSPTINSTSFSTYSKENDNNDSNKITTEMLKFVEKRISKMVPKMKPEEIAIVMPKPPLLINNGKVTRITHTKY